LSDLRDVLVVTVRKSFWASPEAERWPRRLYLRQVYGPSTNLVNSLLVFARALVAIWLRPPRVVLLGSVERAVPWFIRARRLGLLRGAKLVVTNQLTLSPEQLAEVDRIVVYARGLADGLGEKGVFLPLPADGDFAAAQTAAPPGGYVFAGGGTDRDFATLVEAVRGSDVRLELIVFSRDQLPLDLPPNVQVDGPVPVQRFLERMAGADVVVVPLRDGRSAHGQTTVVQALALGKPVVATRSVGVVDYVEDGREGLLVSPEDVDGLRRALATLRSDDPFRESRAAAAAARGAELTPAEFARGLEALCQALVDLDG